MELELELIVGSTPHFPPSERLRLVYAGKCGRIVVSHTEAGVGPWNDTRTTLLTKPG